MIHFKIFSLRSNIANSPAYMGSRTFIHATNILWQALFYVLGI